MSWDVIGHAWAVTLLKKHVVDSRIRHAYLFVGPESVGKRTLANRYAQALSCERPSSSGGYCGECRACRLVERGEYPDLHVLTPDPSIQVDDVRELQRMLALKPYEGPWRIAILEDFHRATTSAANAMLKTLEEPPDQVVILVTAVAPELLLPTVVSRCEVIPLRGVSAETLAAALEDIDPDRAEMMSALSEGRPGRALRWISDPSLLEQRSTLLNQMVAALGMDLGGRFALAEELVGRGRLPVQRERVRSALQVWLSLWRDLLYQGYQAEVEPRNPDRLHSIREATASIAAEDRYLAVRALSSTLSAVDNNANLRLALEALMLELPKV